MDERQRIARARYAKVLTLRNEGWRLKDIAKEMGVSIERVRQMEMTGRRIAWYQTPEGAAELAKEQAEKQVAEAAQAARRDRLKRARADSLAVYLARVEREPQPSPEQRAIVRAHAEQQLWRQFIEPHGAWRRPLIGPQRSLHDWLNWRGSAGVTYRNVTGQFEPEWRASVSA